MKKVFFLGMLMGLLVVMPNTASGATRTRVVWKGLKAGDANSPCKGICLFDCKVEETEAEASNGGSLVHITTTVPDVFVTTQVDFYPLLTPAQVAHRIQKAYANQENVTVEVTEFDDDDDDGSDLGGKAE